MVAMLTNQMNDTTISISGNQMFVVFKTNHEISARGFHAFIMESKYFDQNRKLEINCSCMSQWAGFGTSKFFYCPNSLGTS